MKKCLTILLLTALSLSVDPNIYTLEILPTNRGAMCLDGSPVGLYYHRGSSNNTRKVMIYMNGGGFCSGFTL